MIASYTQFKSTVIVWKESPVELKSSLILSHSLHNDIAIRRAFYWPILLVTTFVLLSLNSKMSTKKSLPSLLLPSQLSLTYVHSPNSVYGCPFQKGISDEAVNIMVVTMVFTILSETC